ncbi:MAG: AadA family aminoglycoside 3''-O-nucleotidyltransferase [Chloroflexota bacterium]
MENSVPIEIAEQVSLACDIINRHLASTVQAIHLYGSAVDGGLKPRSDIDLLVTVDSELAEATRQAFSLDLLDISASPGKSEIFRALEVTVVVQDEVNPWRYPVRRELQFGEWLRTDILNGNIAPAVIDADLAVLLTKVRLHSLPLLGPLAKEFFDPVPKSDLFRALADTLKQWALPSDWAGDERNVVLTFTRIWYSVVTGEIVPKDVAADWSIARLPVDYQSILYEARQAYLGNGEDNLASRTEQTTDSILFMKSQIAEILNAGSK